MLEYAQELSRLEQLKLKRADPQIGLTSGESNELKQLRKLEKAHPLGLSHLTEADQKLVVQERLNVAMVEGIKRAFPNVDMQRQVFLTLVHWDNATQVAIRGDGGPQFSNAPRELCISIHTENLPAKCLEGAAYFKFHSEHGLPGKDGTVQIGRTEFRRNEFDAGEMTRTAIWEVTAHPMDVADQSGKATASEAKLWSASYDASFLLKKKTSPPPSLV
ncbi:hypothetical protein [Pandoraea oxalativorans]|uniref:hypothetical protein n=1 Tax=Pandoraea oxalativorans TaxID=573737 RepID=UPI000A73987C|nr:hypothetical protein [Pandoraea oxalativorans]